MAEEMVLAVEGMTCGGCERAVVRALDGLDGVDEASASHERGEVRLRYDAGLLTRAEVEERIRDAGYTVAN